MRESLLIDTENRVLRAYIVLNQMIIYYQRFYYQSYLLMKKNILIYNLIYGDSIVL